MRKIRNLLRFVGFLAILGYSSSALADDEFVYYPLERATGFMRAWEQKNDTVVDSGVILDIATSLQILYEIVGFVGENPEKSLFSDAILEGSVERYLGALGKSVTIKSFESELLATVGLSVDQLGLRERTVIDLTRRVDLQVASDVGGLIYMTRSGDPRELAVDTAHLLLRPGPHEFLLLSASQELRSQRIHIPMRRSDGSAVIPVSFRFADADAADRRIFGRAGPDFRKFCDPAGRLETMRALLARLDDSYMPAAFFRAQSLEVAVSGIPDGCGDRCRSAIERLVVAAIATWRTGCRRCGIASLNAIRFHDAVWIDDAVVLEYAAKAIEPSYGDPRANVTYAQSLPGRMAPHVRSSPLGYHRLGVDVEMVDEICTIAGELGELERHPVPLICDRAARTCSEPSCLAFQLDLGGGEGLCDLTKRIACGTPDRAVALNANAFGFLVNADTGKGADADTFSLGQGQMVFDLGDVLLHEIGHWFGLPHNTGAPLSVGARPAVNVMSNRWLPDDRVCVAGTDLSELDRAADLNYPNRLDTSHGLGLAVE